MIESFVMQIANAIAAILPFDCLEPAFMRRALLGLLLIAPLAAVSGIHVVNSRMAFFSDAIGHSSFAGVAIGLILGISVSFTMPLLGILIGFLIMFLRRRSSLSSDAVIGIIYSAVAAFGLAIVSRNRAAARNVNMFLFGDILTISEREILGMAVLLILFILFQIFAYNRMFAIAINPQLAAIHKIRVGVYQHVFAALLSLVVIFSVRAVGVMLVTAIMVIPAATARNLAADASRMFWYSLGISIVTCVAGLVISAQEAVNVPAGAAIVLISAILFAGSFLYAYRRRGRSSDMEK